jgi:hypothetical protein
MFAQGSGTTGGGLHKTLARIEGALVHVGGLEVSDLANVD